MRLGDFSVMMSGFSHADLMSAFVGAYFYQVVWYSLSATGLILLPFLAHAIKTAREAAEDDNLNDSTEQQWGRFWVKTAVMMGVMIFCAAPTIKVGELAVRMQLRQCDADPSLVNSAEESYDQLLSTTNLFTFSTKTLYQILRHDEIAEYASEKAALNGLVGQLTMSGDVVRVPIWWHFWRQVMLGVGAHITAKIPCDNGLRVLKHQISTNFIEDPALAAEFGRFMAQCTIPAKAKLEAFSSNALDETAFLPNYPFYLDSDSFYASIRASEPVWGFGVVASERGYDAASAPNSALPPAPTGYGYPTCDTWWRDNSTVPSEPVPGRESINVPRGLEQRLFNYYGLVDPQFCGKYAALLDFKTLGDDVRNCDLGDGNTESAVLSQILKEQLLGQSEASMKAQKVLSKHLGDQAQFGSHNFTQEGSKLSSLGLGLVGDIGLHTSAFKDFSGNLALLKAMPLATSMLIMIVTILLPLGMVVSRYELEPLAGLTLTYCGFLLWIPYFRIVRWLDDNFVGMIVASYQSNMQIMLEMMIAAAYIAVPMLMGSVFTVAGIRVAQLDPIGGDKMGSIANKAATNAVNTISSLPGVPGKIAKAKSMLGK